MGITIIRALIVLLLSGVVFMVGHFAKQRLSFSKGKKLSWVFFALNLLFTVVATGMFVLSSAIGGIFGSGSRATFLIAGGFASLALFLIDLIVLFRIQKIGYEKVIRIYNVVLLIVTALFILPIVL